MHSLIWDNVNADRISTRPRARTDIIEIYRTRESIDLTASWAETETSSSLGDLAKWLEKVRIRELNHQNIEKSAVRLVGVASAIRTI